MNAAVGFSVDRAAARADGRRRPPGCRHPRPLRLPRQRRRQWSDHPKITLRLPEAGCPKLLINLVVQKPHWHQVRDHARDVQEDILETYRTGVDVRSPTPISSVIQYVPAEPWQPKPVSQAPWYMVFSVLLHIHYPFPKTKMKVRCWTHTS